MIKKLAKYLTAAIVLQLAASGIAWYFGSNADSLAWSLAFAAGFIVGEMTEQYGWFDRGSRSGASSIKAEIDKAHAAMSETERNLSRMEAIVTDLEQRAAGARPALH
jgi:hypothetical protein